MRLQLVSIGFFVCALLCYLPFVSRGLDDFDAFSFALAMQHYDLRLQQPQPPGFPLYISAANALNLLTGDAQRALGILSALAGAAGVVALFHLGRSLFGVYTGMIAAVWLLALPGWWLHSALALSDVAGLALPLMACACLVVSVRPRWQRRWWLAGWAIAGLSLGVRPHNALMLVVVGLAVVGWLPQGRLRALGLATLSGACGCLIWFLPQMQAAGGLDALLAAISQQGQHVLSADSLFSALAQPDGLTRRLAAFVQGWRDLSGDQGGLLAGALLVALIGVAGWRGKSRAVWLCIAWLVLVAGKLFTLESLERPRLYLPILPPLLLLIGCGWSRWLVKQPVLRLSIVVVPFMAMLSVGIPLVARLHDTPSAPEQAAAFIRATYAPANTLLIAWGSYRAVQYTLPEYPVLYMQTFEPVAWRQQLAAQDATTLVLLDRDEYTTLAVETLSEGYLPVDDRTFERNRAIFPQHVSVRVQTLTRADVVTPEQLQLPPNGSITPLDGRYFGEGWYRAEDIGGTTARWTDQRAVLRVTLPTNISTMRLTVTPFNADQRVQIMINGYDAGTYAPEGIWQVINVPLAAAWLDQAMTTITLNHARADVPTGSNRALAAAYALIAFE